MKFTKIGDMESRKFVKASLNQKKTHTETWTLRSEMTRPEQWIDRKQKTEKREIRKKQTAYGFLKRNGEKEQK